MIGVGVIAEGYEWDLNKVRKDHLSFLGGLLGSLDGLDFLQQEGTDYSALNATTAKYSSVRPGDSLVFLGETLVVVGSELGDAVEALSAFAAVVGRAGSVSSLLNVLHDNSGTGSADLPDLIGGSVVAKSASVGDSLDHLW